jgi:1-acyl-sn-glycerol-3-phosphate acyltransferase
MDLPELPATFPRRGNAFTRALGRLALRVTGWRVTGNFPDRAKLVVVVAPHTSNWDTFLGIVLAFALGFDAHWLAKHTLFSGPLGPLMRWVGGIPVDRSRPTDRVDQITAEFVRRDQLLLAIAPEGTRGKVERWKSGFWRIARAAAVPMVPAWFDYARREIGIGPALEATDDYPADLARIMEFYRGVTPRHPERF